MRGPPERVDRVGEPRERTPVRPTRSARARGPGAAGRRAGGEQPRDARGERELPSNQFGSFTFGTDTSTNPVSAAISVGFFDPASTADARASLTGTILGGYLNDEWRPVPSLALNAGLRYDVEPNTVNNDFTVPWASDTTLQRLPELGRHLNRGDRKNDLNNVSPRLSFSWDPTGKNSTFLRGGFGIVYDRVASFIGFQERLNGAWRTYGFVNPGTTDPEVLRQRVTSGTVATTPALVLVKDKMETPRNTQWSVGLGRQLTPAVGLNLDYINQRMSNLYVRLNPNYFNTATRQRALTPRYGDITLWDDFGRATFRGVIAQGLYQRAQTRVNLAYTLGRDANANNVFTDDFIDGSRTVRPSNAWRNWYRTADVRLARPLVVAGGRKLSASLEVFNLFNFKNVAGYGSRQFPATGADQLPNFMQPTSAFAARQAQLGVRADF